MDFQQSDYLAVYKDNYWKFYMKHYEIIDFLYNA